MIRTRVVFGNQFCGTGAEMALPNHFAFVTAADVETPAVEEIKQYCPTHRPTIQPRWIVANEDGRPQLRMSWTAVRQQQTCGTTEEEK